MRFYHSIRFKINVIFVIALVAMAFMLLLSSGASTKREHHLARLQAPYIEALILQERDSMISLQHRLKELGVTLIDETQKVGVLAKASEIRSHRRTDPRFRLYQLPDDKDAIFILLNSPDKLVKVIKQTFEFQDTLTVLLWIAILFVIILYTTLMFSLKPLRHIYDELHRYARYQTDIDIRSKRKDEIALLSNAFQDAIDQNRSLVNARTLFMRNILHELNTPITKGRLMAAMSEQFGDELDAVFSSLEQYIKEMAEIEKMTSHQYRPTLDAYPIVEIIDHASDMLFLDTSVEHDVGSSRLRCDFTMMGIVFKNLIDNALKYGSALHVFIEEDRLIFENDGEPLAHDISYYTQAFTQDVSSENGFGLGLYIIDEILQQQESKLIYAYVHGRHRFMISLI